MDLHFVGDYALDERVAAIVALSIGIYLEAEAAAIAAPVDATSRWTAAARLESRGIPVSTISLRRGWRAYA